jgi:hypothetical protein
MLSVATQVTMKKYYSIEPHKEPCRTSTVIPKLQMLMEEIRGIQII